MQLSPGYGPGGGLARESVDGGLARSRSMRRRVALASCSACSFVRPLVIMRRESLVAPALVVFAVSPLSDSAALPWGATCASTFSGAGPAADGVTSECGDIDSPTVAGDLVEASGDGPTSALGDIDSRPVASVRDWSEVSAVRAGAADVAGAGTGAVSRAPLVTLPESGGCVESWDIQ